MNDFVTLTRVASKKWWGEESRRILSGRCSSGELGLQSHRIENCLSGSLAMLRKRAVAAARRKGGTQRAQEGSGRLCSVCVSVFNRREGPYFYIKWQEPIERENLETGQGRELEEKRGRGGDAGGRLNLDGRGAPCCQGRREGGENRSKGGEVCRWEGSKVEAFSLGTGDFLNEAGGGALRRFQGVTEWTGH